MPSTATITALYTFSPDTLIRSSYHNTMFSIWRGHIIPIDPNTATAAPTQTYDLGSQDYRWRSVYGKLSPRIDSTTGSMTLGVAHDVVFFNPAATVTATLPASVTATMYTIKNIGSAGAPVKMACNGVETIDNTTTLELVDQESMTIVGHGGKWYTI